MGTFPPHYIERAEIIEDRGVLATTSDPQLPLGPLLGDRLRLWRFNHVVIKRRILTNTGPLGKANRSTRLHDQHEVVARLWHHTVVSAFGDNEVVTLTELQRAEVAL